MAWVQSTLLPALNDRQLYKDMTRHDEVGGRIRSYFGTFVQHAPPAGRAQFVRALVRAIATDVVSIAAAIHHTLALFANRKLVEAAAFPAMDEGDMRLTCILLRDKFQCANVPMRRRLLRTLVPLVTHFYGLTDPGHEQHGDCWVPPELVDPGGWARLRSRWAE